MKQRSIAFTYFASILGTAFLLVLLIFFISYNTDYQSLKGKIAKRKGQAISKIESQIESDHNSVLNYLEFFKKTALKIKKDELKDDVTKLHNVLSNIYNEEIKSKNEEAVKNYLKKIIKKYENFRGNSYYFVWNANDKLIYYPIDPSMINKDLSKFEDDTASKSIAEFMKYSKINDQGFYKYKWSKKKPNDTFSFDKISYFSRLKELNWVIGTGFYLDDLNKYFKEVILKGFESGTVSFSEDILIIEEPGTVIFHNGKSRLNKRPDQLFNIDEGKYIYSKFKKDSTGKIIEYAWNNNDGIKTKRIAKISYLKELNWHIVLKKDFENVEKEIEQKKEALENEYFSGMENLIIFLVVFSIVISIIIYLIYKRHKRVQNEIIKFFDETLVTHRKLKTENFIWREYAEVAKSANEYVDRFEQYEETIGEQVLEIEKSKEILENRASELIQLNLRLEDSEKKLQELDEAKNKFISIISHDLRSPFTGLLGMTEIIKEEYDNMEDAEKREIIKNIRSTTKRLYSFIEELLDWGRIQTNRMEFSKEQFDISIITEEIIKLLENNANKKGIQVINKINEKLFVTSDKNVYSTVLRNLISNAVKFTSKGDKIVISAKELNYYIEISVEDTGVGIDEAELKNLFKIDVQHTSVGTNQERGTGVGLILCKELIEKIGGKIWVKSEPNVGSKFSFTIRK